MAKLTNFTPLEAIWAKQIYLENFTLEEAAVDSRKPRVDVIKSVIIAIGIMEKKVEYEYSPEVVTDENKAIIDEYLSFMPYSYLIKPKPVN